MKNKSGLWLLVAALLILVPLVAACAAPTPTPTPPPTLTPTGVPGAMLDKKLETRDLLPESTLTLDIPEGALPEGVKKSDITIEPLNIYDLPDDMTALPEDIITVAVMELGPDGLVFNEPVTFQMTIPFGRDILYTVFHISSSGTKVVEDVSVEFNADEKITLITGKISHFSFLAAGKNKADETANEFEKRERERSEALKQLRLIRHQQTVEAERAAGTEAQPFDALLPLQNVFASKGQSISSDDVEMYKRLAATDFLSEKTTDLTITPRDSAVMYIYLDDNYQVIPRSDWGSQLIKYYIEVDLHTFYGEGWTDHPSGVGLVHMTLVDFDTGVIRWAGTSAPETRDILDSFLTVSGLTKMYDTALRDIEQEIGQEILPPPPPTPPTPTPTPTPTPEAPASAGPPVLVDPDNFEMVLLADLSGFPRNWTFEFTITNGEYGFPSGLYITGGPSFADDNELRRLFHVDSSGTVTVVEDRFEKGVESLVFARGAYGDGMLLTEPQSLRINRLLPDGTLSTFASLGTEPFGPTQLAYGHDGTLYVTDFTGGNILRVHSDGSSEWFASVPLDARASVDVSGGKALMLDTSGQFGGGFLTATFSANFRNAEPHNLDAIYSVSPDGEEVTRLATGLTGIEFLTLGPGGAFGSDLFVSTHGTDLNGDGAVYTMTPDGTLTPFMTGIDAVHVVFDTEGIMGGGMFVADLYNPWGAPEDPVSKIWHVVPKPPTPTTTTTVYPVDITVLTDPAGHASFIGQMPDQLTVTVTESVISISGEGAFVSVNGELMPDGTFVATGSGTVAGFSGTSVSFTGQLTDAGIAGEYTMGINGNLPTGQPITYSIGLPPPPPTPTTTVYPVDITVLTDPAGHALYIGQMPVQLTVTVDEYVISISGEVPFVSVEGELMSDGTFVATGSGTVAGFSGTSVSFTGWLTNGGITGEYAMGGNGNLPTGQPITYSVQLPPPTRTTTVYPVDITVLTDLAGHASFIGQMPDQLTVTVTESVISISGEGAFVSVNGELMPDGTFVATGSGTVAGFSGTSVSFTGWLTNGGIAGEYTMGVNGNLPTGQPITYSVQYRP